MKISKRVCIASISLVLVSTMALSPTVLSAYADDTTIESSTETDYNNLADGKYTLYAEMLKTDHSGYSMSNNAIDHTVTLEVINGEYYITFEFKGLSIYGQFGYLSKLYYFNEGYTYGQYGIPTGELTQAEVLSTYDVVDQYNTIDTPYPHELRVKLVDKANVEYAPLQVFVPIMEAISEGGGTQNVLLSLDWNTLQPIEQSTTEITTTTTTTETTTTSEITTLTETTTSLATTTISETITLPETTTITENTTLPNTTTSTTTDYNNLADGKYQVYAEMIKTDRENYSMSNNGINHTIGLEVINGEYYATVQFKGLSIYNQFGYLMDLYYYDTGYTYNQYGTPEGNIIPAEVLSTYDVVDQYNDSEHLYPQTLKFKLVDKATQQYVPLQVFVPIMEAIADGTGTQSVLMQIDWSTLVKTDSDIEIETPEEQSPEFNYTDTATGVTIHADKGILEDGVSATVTEVTNGTEYSNVGTLIGLEQYKLYDISLSSDVNGIIQIGIPVPQGYQDVVVYRVDGNQKTMVTGSIDNGVYTFSAKSVGKYVIANKTSNSTTTTTTTTTNTTTNNSAKSSNTSPSTGESSKVGYLVSSLLAISTAIATKKRKG